MDVPEERGLQPNYRYYKYHIGIIPGFRANPLQALFTIALRLVTENSLIKNQFITAVILVL